MPLDMIPGGRLPLTGGTLNIGSTRSLKLTGPSAVSYTWSFPVNAINHTTELTLDVNNPGLTTLVLKNTASTGYSAVSLDDTTGREKTSYGFGGPTSSSNYVNAAFIEAFNGYGFGGSGVAPPPLRFTRTGWNSLLSGTSAGSDVNGTTLNIVGAPTVTVQANQVVSGAGVTVGSIILSQLTGTPGGIGTYLLDRSSAATGAITITLTGGDTQEVAYEFGEDWSQTWSQGNAHTTRGMKLYPSGGLAVGQTTADPTTGFIAVSAGGGYRFDGRSKLVSTADGIVALQNTAGDGFGRLAFGPVTSGFSAIFSNGITASLKLADNSAYAGWNCGSINTQGGSANLGDTTVSSGNLVMSQTSSVFGWTSNTAFRHTANGIIKVTNTAQTGGANLDFTTADALGLKNLANTAQAKITTGPLNYAADAGSSDDYAITLAPALLSYQAGQAIYFKAATANTGAATLNVNGLGAKTIVKAVNTTLANNDILANMYCHVVYDGTNFVLMNPRAL